MIRAMRVALTALIVLSASSTAHASSPEFPICDADEPLGFLVAEPGQLAPGCAVRWIEPEPVAGGVRFELHAPDGQLIGDGVDPTALEVQAPERRHECDGTVVDTVRSVYEYSVTFQTAQQGDQVWVIDTATGNVFANATYEGQECTTIALAASECQVCGPEASMGCADVSGGRGTGVLVFAALGAIMLRRRRRSAAA
jgi:hypothetical protein